MKLTRRRFMLATSTLAAAHGTCMRAWAAPESHLDEPLLQLAGNEALVTDAVESQALAFDRAVEAGAVQGPSAHDLALIELPRYGVGRDAYVMGAIGWKGLDPRGELLASAPVSATGAITLALPRQTQFGYVIDTPDGNFNLASGETATPATLNGQPCLADTNIVQSTYKSVAANTYLAIRPSSPALMRFARSDVPATTLVLQVTLVRKKGTVRVYELVPPVELMPPRCGDLHDVPDLRYQDRTERSGSIGPKRQGWSWSNHIRQGGATGIDAREASFQYDVWVSPEWMTALVEGGKFPGFASAGKPDGNLYAGNGGGAVNGRNGWSLRGGYYRPITDPQHAMHGYMPVHTYGYYLSRVINGKTYLFHELQRRLAELGLWVPGGSIGNNARKVVKPGEAIDLSSNTGNVIMWDYGIPSGLVKVGEWTTIRQDMRVNDPAVSNGWLHAYVNGQQVGKIDDLMLRLDGPYSPRGGSTLGIGRVWFNFYHGGVRFPRAEAHIKVRNIAIKVWEWDA
jgi:hypothetical protein